MIDKKLFFEEIKKALPNVPLSPREHKILDMRFGLSDNITHSLEECGKTFGVTRERIRQIEFKVLEKMRNGGWLKSG